uniref:Protein kinase domain-containing protein n=1 Tax=Brassica campestris TaxID=3711 RepID=M4CYD4_BRACM
MTIKQQWRCLAAAMLTAMLFALAETDTDPLEGTLASITFKVKFRLACLQILPTCKRFIQLRSSFKLTPECNSRVSSLFVDYRNLAYNNLTQGLPFSLPLMTSLVYLNLSHNSLTGALGNVFSGLQIKEMNIEDNQFSGIIPSHFQSIPHLWIWGNKFHVEPNYKPWKFPLDVIPMIQNATGYPTTESSAIMNFPRPQKVIKKKKKGIGAGSMVLLVGGVALLGTFFALFAVGMNHRRAQNLAASHRSNNSTTYTLPVSTGREFSAAPEDNPQMKRIRPPPVPQLRRVPPPPVRIDKPAGRKSFSASCQYPAYAKLFSAAELQLATDGFSEENLLGEGPIGSVYRAKLPDGQVYIFSSLSSSKVLNEKFSLYVSHPLMFQFAAVRNIPMSSLSLHEEEKFTEVLQTASKLRHPNIVTLLGFCIDNGQHLLVYEYVGHLSLYNAMHDKVYKPLSWGLRLRIAIGVARALDYLHSSFSLPIAHSDLKATNILLDEELTPRIADCGLASLRPLTSNSVKLRASEIAIQNTGYIAPEHGQPGSSGTKSDTFALGVLLLELLTGRKAFDSSRPEGEQLLVKWASTRLHDRRSLEQMIDQGIVGTFSSRVASHYADIISLCTQAEKEFRPPVSEIVEALTSLIQKQNKESSSVADKTEIDPFSKSFCSTRTRFLSSPTSSHISN